MIINIQNVRSSEDFSAVRFSEIAAQSRFTARFDNSYFVYCMKHALLTSIVTCDREVEGVCVCVSSKIPDSCEVEMIAISSGLRRIMLGKKLLSHSLRNMRSMKQRTAFAWVNENNSEAMAFFRDFGFEPDGRRRSARNRTDGEDIRLKIDIY